MHPFTTSRVPLPIQVQQHLLHLIQDRTYQPGEQLPSEVDLAAQLGISRPTLREALLSLEQEGVIIRKHGVGTFVAPQCGRRLESGLERLESILELAARQGMHIELEALQVREEPADAELAEKLQVTPGTPLTSVQRVIVVDQAPAAFMVDVAHSAVLSPADIDQTFQGSVLDLLRQKPDVQITQAVADIVALNADAALAEKLHLEPEQAVLLLEETLFDPQGDVVEYSRNYFVPDLFRFHVVRS